MITKIAEGWASRKARERQRQPGERRDGAQHLENGGRGRRIAQVALADQHTQCDCHRLPPARMPMATRLRLLERCQKAPLSIPPLS